MTEMNWWTHCGLVIVMPWPADGDRAEAEAKAIAQGLVEARRRVEGIGGVLVGDQPTVLWLEDAVLISGIETDDEIVLGDDYVALRLIFPALLPPNVELPFYVVPA